MRLDVESLRTLLALHQTRAFAAAAARLNLTQPAVSHKLRRLERAIGQTLVKRGTGPLSLTRVGAELVAYAERIVALHDEAVGSLKRESYSGVIELGLTEALISGDIARLLGQFGRLYPEVEVRSRVDTSKKLAEGLRAGLFDIALLQTFADQVGPRDTRLYEEPLVWVASADLGTPVGQQVPYVSFDRECFYRNWAEEALRADGRVLKTVIECSSLAGTVSAVQAGLGISLIPATRVTAAMREVDGLPQPRSTVTVIRTAHAVPPQQVAALAKLCGTMRG